MTCGVSSRRVVREALLNRELRPRAGDAPRDFDSAFEIAGTWDFKWPLKTQIRVAFQFPPARMSVSDRDFETAKGIVQEYASRWKLPDALTLSFDAPDLDPPLEDAAPEMSGHRSSFLRQEPRENPYDVLVSLQDLPVTKRDPFRGRGKEDEHIELPVSTLGSYARRADYGAPTMYVGRFGRFLGESFLGYLRDPLAQHVIVHEFGHALGLPHLHQHPDLIVPNEKLPRGVRARIEALDGVRGGFYKSPQSVKDMLVPLLGLEIGLDVVEDHLLRVWRGNVNFSDWEALKPEVLAEHTRSGTLASVMTFPYYPFTKLGMPEPDPCSDSASVYRALAKSLVAEPGAEDIAMLKKMYEP